MLIIFAPTLLSLRQIRVLLNITFKETQGFIHCLFKVDSLAMLNKPMVSSLATYDALSLVITKAFLFGFA